MPILNLTLNSKDTVLFEQPLILNIHPYIDDDGAPPISIITRTGRGVVASLFTVESAANSTLLLASTSSESNTSNSKRSYL